MTILSGLLILISAYVGISHGLSTLTNSAPAGELKMMSDIGITETMRKTIAGLSLVLGILILFPQTFFVGNLMRAIMLIVTMALSLKINNFKFELIEIPFLLMPLALIYLGYSLKK